MARIDQLRAQLGESARNKTDEELLSLVARATNQPESEVASRYNYRPTASGVTGLRFGAAIDRYQAGLYGLGEAITGSDAMRRRREANEFQAAVASQRAQAQGAVDRFSDVGSVRDFGSYLAGLAIQSSPYIAETLGGGLAARTAMSGTRAALRGGIAAGAEAQAGRAATTLRRGQLGGAVAASYPSAVGEILQAQREQTGGEVDLASAGALGVPFAGLNVLGFESGILGGRGLRAGIQRLDEMTGLTGGLTRAGVTGLRVGATEAAAEVGQEALQDLGRKAVDPEAEFWDDSAPERYFEAAAGGFFLGKTLGAGAGGWRRTAQTPEEQARQQLQSVHEQARILREQQSREADLTQTVDTDLEIGLGIIPPTNPYDVGGYVSQFQQAGETGIEGQQGLFGEPAPAQMQAEMDALGAAPTDTTTQDPVAATRDADREFRDTYRMVANQYSRALVAAVEAEGLTWDADIISPIVTEAEKAGFLTKAKYDALIKKLDKRMLDARREAEIDQQVVAPVVSSPGVSESAGGLPAAAPAVAGLSQGAPVAAPTQVPATPSVAPAAATAVQEPSAPAAAQVVTPEGEARGPQAPQAQQTEAQRQEAATPAAVSAEAAWDRFSPDGAPAFNELAPALQEAWTRAAQQGETSWVLAEQIDEANREDSTAGVDPRVLLMSRLFDGKNAVRNAEMFIDRMAMGMSLEAIGEKYGLSTSGVGKIVGREKDAVTRTQAMLDRARARGLDLNEVQDALRSLAEEGQARGELDIQNMFGDVEATSAEAAQADLGTRASSLGGGGANIAANLNAFEQSTIEVLTQLRNERSPQRRAELEAKLAQLEDQAKAQERRTQAKIRETAGQRSKKDQRAEQEQAAAMAVAELGAPDAVQEQAATEVSVQPEAQAGQRVGRQVRRAQEPAAEGQATRKGTFTFRHGTTNQNLTRFAPRFAGFRYDGTGGTFGSEGVYLDNTGEWTGPTGMITAPYVYEVEATFDNAFVLQPGTADQLFAILRDSEITPAESGWTGKDIVSALKAAGHDAIIVEDFGPDGIDSYGKDSSRFRALREAFGNQRVDPTITQDQVFAFDPRKLRVKEQVSSPPVAAEGQALTTQETYAQVVSVVPNAPAFADLTPAQQKQITDLANRDQLNLAAINRIFDGDTRAMTRGEPKANTEGRELAQVMDTLARGMTRIAGARDLNGVRLDITPTTPEALRQVQAVAEVFDAYQNDGLGNAVNAVENWFVTSTPVTWDGVFTTVDGKPSIVLNARVLMTLPAEAAWTVRHEIGHAIDQLHKESIFASDPEFNLSVTQDRIIPRSQMMQDIVKFREDNPTSELAEQLKYPLDIQHTGRLGADEVRQEVFAQLWAFYTTSESNRNFLEDNLPFVFDYFDGAVNETVKLADYRGEAASPSQVASQQEQAATQAESLQSGRVRTRQQIEGVVRAHTRQPGERIKNLNRIPEPARGPARAISTALEDIGGRVLDFAMFTHTLVDRAVKLGMTSAKNLQRTLAARDLMAREEENAVKSILNGYANLPQNERGKGDGSVNRFLFDSTRTGKWGYGDNADPAMAERFRALSPEGKRLVQDIFAHGDRMLQRKKDIVLNSTRSEFDAQIENAQTREQKAELRKAKQLALKRFESLFNIREGRPYAPIKRNGNYVVIAMSKEYMAAKQEENKAAMERLEADGDHYHVTFTDGKNAAISLRSQLEEQGAFADVQVAQRDTVTDELFSNSSAMQQLTKLRANVDARVKAGEKEAGPLLSMINQMYLEALAEGSARKSEMKRRGVDGEVDMISSFGAQGLADANFLASLQYNDQVTDVLNAMRAEAKTGDRTRKSEVLNELAKRYSESLEVPNNPWLNKLLRLSSIHYLASSPGYYLQNLTQPFMMSVPAMAGTYNYGTVVSELYKAYTELGPVMKSAKLFSQQLDFSTVPADVKNAINELVNRGRIDIGLETELGEFQVDGQSRFGAAWNRVDKGLRMAVQKGEAVNRLSTAIAAYRLARNQGKLDADAAIDYADRILLETHGDYGRFAAPRVFNNPVGRMALQFRKFQLIQLTWYAKMVKDAFSDNPVQRATALKSLAFGLAHTGVLAGAMGLPGYYAVAWALSVLLGDEEGFDLNDEIRKMIGDPDIANMVLRGVPVLGGADWSGKIGAGTMISIMPFSNADLTTRSGIFEAIGSAFGGASGAMVAKGVDGLGLLANGEYMKGTELLLPKGLGDLIKTYRLGTDGATRRNNDVILPAGELSGLELMWQALGIPPAQMTAMYERQQRVRTVEQNLQSRSTRIRNNYVQAVRRGDTDAAAKARDDWQSLQDARVRVGLNRQPLSNLLRAPREQMRRERDTAGGIQFTRATRGMVEDIAER